MIQALAKNLLWLGASLRRRRFYYKAEQTDYQVQIQVRQAWIHARCRG